MKKILFVLCLLSFGCSSESPREKAKRYLGYVDSFYVSFDDAQEKKLEEIVDHYFDSKKDDLKINKKIYEHLEVGLAENKRLDPKYVEKLINQKIEMNKKIIPKQLELINQFYESLTPKQKKEMLAALNKLKKKSARMRFWLGEGEAK